MVNQTTRKILVYKANALKADPEYSVYVEKILKEWDIKDAKEAFILGAIDTMIHGAALAMNGGDAAKISLLKEIMNK